MRKERVQTPSDALLYLTDCTLATVADMASKKSRRRHEFERQCSMAQMAIDWMFQMEVDMSGTRAVDVLNYETPTVAAWSEQFFPLEEQMRLARDRDSK